MGSIVIVDDDRLALSAVNAYLRAGASPHAIIGSFTDPQEAARFLAERACDLLITDIKMPRMSGFELIERVKASRPGIRVIVLSGHADFALARDAISLKVDEYILKHEMDAPSLQKAVDRLLPGRTAADAGGAHGLATFDQYRAARDRHGAAADALLVAVYTVKRRYDETGAEAAAAPNLLMLCQMIAETLARFGAGECFLGSRQDIVIIQPVDGELPVERQGRALQRLREILDGTSRYLNFRAFIAVADSLHAVGDVEAGYAEAHANAGLAFFLKENALILPSLCGSRDMDGLSVPPLAFHEGFQAGAWGEQMEAFFAIPFRGIRDGARRMKLHITVALESINSLLLRSYALSFESILGQSAGSLYEQIFQMDDETALKAMLIRLGTRLEDAISRHRRSRTLVGSVQAYIERNFARPLSLNEIADIFAVNMSYLSTLFKQETGTGFIDYVHRVRLGRACALFTDTRLSLKEIAFAVGYQSADHFSKVFSRMRGETATDCRERLLRERGRGADGP